MKLAVIDLGTNTFHILIVEVDAEGSFKECYRERQFVQLGEEGVETIGQAAFNRGLATLKKFKTVLSQHDIAEVKAFGTAALRSATNGQTFIQRSLEETGIQIELISGEREALLICKGARKATPIGLRPVLIMDIGGGSVEFIIANQQQVFWAKSYPIGLAILFRSFHKKDPIHHTEIENLSKHLQTILTDLSKLQTLHPIETLIGASGTFDVLEAILALEKTSPTWAHVNPIDFPILYDRLVQATLAQRLAMEDVPNQRAELIVVAMILIQEVLKTGTFNHIWVSSFAMKEGMLLEMIESNKK